MPMGLSYTDKYLPKSFLLCHQGPHMEMMGLCLLEMLCRYTANKNGF